MSKATKNLGGRPRLKATRVFWAARLLPETVATIKSRAKERAMSESHVVDEAVNGKAPESMVKRATQPKGLLPRRRLPILKPSAKSL